MKKRLFVAMGVISLLVMVFIMGAVGLSATYQQFSCYEISAGCGTPQVCWGNAMFAAGCNMQCVKDYGEYTPIIRCAVLELNNSAKQFSQAPVFLPGVWVKSWSII